MRRKRIEFDLVKTSCGYGVPFMDYREERTQLDRWWTAIEAGKTTEDLPVLRGNGESIPPPRVWADKNPEADHRPRAARTQPAYELLLTPADPVRGLSALEHEDLAHPGLPGEERHTPGTRGDEIADSAEAQQHLA